MNASPVTGFAAATVLAGDFESVFAGLLLTSALLVVVLSAVVVYFLVRYRRGSPAPRPPLGFASWKLETAWIAGTTVGFLVFFFWGAALFLQIERPPKDADEIQVVARQWMWDFRQPNGRREFNELHVPAGRPVRLVLSSEDVIHSFFVPDFRVKQDVVPGRVTSLWFNALAPGEHRVFCSEFCGSKHAEMTARLVVMAPAAYAAWLAEGTTGESLGTTGRRLFIQYGCSGCHSPRSSVHAPLLDGVYQSLVPLQDGRFVRADEAYLVDSILQPASAVVAGYAPVMPSFQNVIPKTDLLPLLAYLKSLKAAPAAAATAP